MSPKMGKHRFATDFDGHRRNVRLYKQELKQP
jgi:cell division protein YceG involved in septum cleavage